MPSRSRCEELKLRVRKVVYYPSRQIPKKSKNHYTYRNKKKSDIKKKERNRRHRECLSVFT